MRRRLYFQIYFDFQATVIWRWTRPHFWLSVSENFNYPLISRSVKVHSADGISVQQLVSRLRLHSSWRKPRKDWTLCEKCHSRVDARGLWHGASWNLSCGSRFWNASLHSRAILWENGWNECRLLFTFVFAFYYFT